MPDFETIEQQVEVGGHQFTLTTLADNQQFHDPNGVFEAAGVAPAMWSLFGILWESGLLLAEAMVTEPLADRTILETGCGLGLASMVIAHRGGTVIASDLHPLAGEFLSINVRHNHLQPIPFETLDWHHEYATLDKFDMIIGSDLLYERGQPELLANFVDHHSKAKSTMILTDPGRKQVGAYTRLMEANGFTSSIETHDTVRLIRYERST
ncbi:MAG: histidine kinase [Pseudomonadales bacterium]